MHVVGFQFSDFIFPFFIFIFLDLDKKHSCPKINNVFSKYPSLSNLDKNLSKKKGMVVDQKLHENHVFLMILTVD